MTIRGKLVVRDDPSIDRAGPGRIAEEVEASFVRGVRGSGVFAQIRSRPGALAPSLQEPLHEGLDLVESRSDDGSGGLVQLRGEDLGRAAVTESVAGHEEHPRAVAVDPHAPADVEADLLEGADVLLRVDLSQGLEVLLVPVGGVLSGL
jgi:hypothetical protein